MKSILLLLSCAATIATAPAAVTLSFDSSTDGFTVVAGGVNAVVWDAGGGNGRLAITTGPGFNMQVAKLDLNSPAFATELANAKLYGGTITYSVTMQTNAVVGAGVSPNPTPGWFEGSLLANSGNFISGGNPLNTNVYDQNFNTAGGNFNWGSYPIAATVTANLSYTIGVSPNGGAVNNPIATFTSGTTNYNEVYLGANSGPSAVTTPVPLPAGFTSATYYIDNFTLTANPVPEPAAAGLTVLALGALALRRRR